MPDDEAERNEQGKRLEKISTALETIDSESAGTIGQLAQHILKPASEQKEKNGKLIDTLVDQGLIRKDCIVAGEKELESTVEKAYYHSAAMTQTAEKPYWVCPSSDQDGVYIQTLDKGRELIKQDAVEAWQHN